MSDIDETLSGVRPLLNIEADGSRVSWRSCILSESSSLIRGSEVEEYFLEYIALAFFRMLCSSHDLEVKGVTMTIGQLG